MARKPRIEYEGNADHVMSRGNRGADIFVDDKDRQLILETLDEACSRMAWEIHAFVLMSNHYHLQMGHVANVSRAVKWMRENADKKSKTLRKKLSRISICKDFSSLKDGVKRRWAGNFFT